VSPVPEVDKVDNDSQQKRPSQEEHVESVINGTTENGSLNSTEERNSFKKEVIRIAENGGSSDIKVNDFDKKISQPSAVEEVATIKKLSRSKTDSDLLKEHSKPRLKSGEYPQIPPKPILPNRSAITNNVDSSSSNTSSPTSPKTWPTSPASPITSPSNFEALKSAGSAQKSRGFIGALRSKSPSSPSRSKSPAKKGGTVKFSHTKDFDDDIPMRGTRSATMSSQQAFHEHHMNKQRRTRKTSNEKARRHSASAVKRTTGASVDKFGYQFSPDMEERLQMKIEQGIENTYGSIVRCIHAASVIQRYYRRWKMRQRFKALRKEVASVSAIRPRAASMKTPMRSQSIRYKTNTATVSILDEFPEIKLLTTRIQSRSKALCHPLQNKNVHSNDVGPTARLRREASLEIQETSMVFTDRSVTPSSDVDVAEEKNDEVFTPMLPSSPEVVLSDSSSELRAQLQPPCVPLSISAEFLASKLHDEKQSRPHSVSIVSHFARSKSVENIMGVDDHTGELLNKPVLKPHESATSLKKKTNIGITLFNRLV